MSKPKASVTRRGVLDVQVCVPAFWDDDVVEGFANKIVPCGTEPGWRIRKEGDKMLGGDPERNPCSDNEGFVHIMLDV